MFIRLRLMDAKQFGLRLRQARLDAGLKQHELGAAMGATHSTVSQWENGVPDGVDAEKLLAAANAVKRSTQYLLYGADDKINDAAGTYGTDALDQMAQHWEALTNSQREELLKTARELAERNREILEELKR